MLITFNPALGDTIYIARPPLFPLSQPTVFPFTARLSAHDYHDLVQAKARVELWSDLPRDNGSGWGKLEFSESWNSALDNSSQQVKTLDLSVSIPATSTTSRFSFTYRVTYPSGHISWLGAFGQNGSLILKEGEDNMIHGLVLREGWREANTQDSWILEISEGISSMEVANMENPSMFRIWALSKDRFIPHPSNASTFFLIPNNQSTLDPTYVMSASPNSSISISSEGRITASGPGIILLHVNNITSEAGLLFQQIISRSKLDQWNPLSLNLKSNIIALASPSSHYPHQVVVIPFWSSQDMHLLVNPANSFADKSKRDAIAMAVFASPTSRIRILDREMDDEICLQSGPLDATSTDFHFFACPFYRLRHPATQDYSTWGVAVLTPHKWAPIPSKPSSILPTPPPSPHLRPIPSPSQLPSASEVDKASTSVSLVVQPDESANDDEACAKILPVPPVATNLPRPENLVSLITIFAALKSFFILLFTILLGPILPPGFSIGQTNSYVQIERPPLGDIDDLPDGPKQPIAEEINVIHKKGAPGSHSVPGDSGTEESMPLEQEDVEPSPIPSKSTAADDISSKKQPSRALSRAEGAFCVELQYDGQEEGGTVEIGLMPLPCQLSSNRDVDPIYATPKPIPKESLERAVRFLDGPIVPSRLREVDVFFHDNSASNGVTTKSSCYVLQYQLDVASLKEGRVVIILPPVDSDV